MPWAAAAHRLPRLMDLDSEAKLKVKVKVKVKEEKEKEEQEVREKRRRRRRKCEGSQPLWLTRKDQYLHCVKSFLCTVYSCRSHGIASRKTGRWHMN